MEVYYMAGLRSQIYQIMSQKKSSRSRSDRGFSSKAKHISWIISSEMSQKDKEIAISNLNKAGTLTGKAKGKGRSKPERKLNGLDHNFVDAVKYKRGISLYSIMLKELHPSLKSRDIKDDVIKTINVYNKFVTNNGLREAQRRMKALLRYYTQQSILGEGTVSQDLFLHFSIKSEKYKRGRIDILNYLDSLDLCKQNLTYLRSLFDIPKVIKGPALAENLDYSEEKRHPSRTEDYRDILSEFRKFLPVYFKQISDVGPINREAFMEHLDTAKDPWVFQSKTGPNTRFLKKDKNTKLGNLDTIVIDSICLKADDGLYELVKNGYEICGLPFDAVEEWSKENLSTYIEDEYSMEDLSCYDIIVVPDNYGKDRKVFRGIYPIQNLLYHARTNVRKFHRKMPNTSFYNQPMGKSIVKQWSMGFPSSHDATNFTTRFPLDLQKIFLEYYFQNIKSFEFKGKDRSFGWLISILLKGSKFRTPEGDHVTLGAGTGMGLFLGAELADITHNILISMLFYRNKKIGRPWAPIDTCDYITNIDDVVFEDVNSKASIQYVETMETLGVGINPTKGFTSDISQDTRISEYLKGLFVDGDDCSALSLNLCQVASKSPSSFIVLNEYFKQNDISDDTIKNIIKLYWGKTFIKKGTFKLHSKANLTSDLYFTFRDFISLNKNTDLTGSVVLHRPAIIESLNQQTFEVDKVEFYTRIMELLRADLIRSILDEFPGYEDHTIDENLNILDFIATVSEVSGHDPKLYLINERLTPRGERCIRLLRDILPRFRSLEEPESLEFSDADFMEYDMSMFEIVVEDLNPDSRLLLTDMEFLREQALDTYGTTQTLSIKDRDKRSQNFCSIYKDLLSYYLDRL